jgi:membrane protease YdiL (CAAX protease family)
MTTGELLVISLIAGVGEEMLFRGFLQTCLATWIGEPYGLILALVVASLTFGACHWLTTTYAALATLVGLYLGVVFYGSGNLLVPVVAHAVYDFAALMYLVKSQRALPDASEPSQVQE